ncbi:MAG: colicin V production protein [Sphingobium sp.]|nr:MAG: colicin V production protein [Sphingobium sp.]
MTALDIMVFLAIGGGALFGVLRGFVCEALSMIAWVLGVLAVSLFHAPVASLLTPFLGTESGAAVLAFVLVFGVTFFAGKFLAKALGARTRTSILGPIDRVLGGGFGAVKGLIGATLVFLAFSLVYDTVYGGEAARPHWLSTSRSYPLLAASGSAISTFIDERRGTKPSA